jgi:NAD(P)H-hydrate epimerase
MGVFRGQYNDPMSEARGLYSVAQVRAFDARAINQLGVPGYTLMNRAGAAALRVLHERWPAVRHLAIVTGAGNNGGDGYMLARLARAAGLTVELLALVAPERLAGDARRAADEYLASGARVSAFDGAALAPAGLLVDALLGTGLRAAPRPEFQAAIRALNAAGKPILALDLPSGLDGDRGIALGEAVRATATITFVAPKAGLYLGEGPGTWASCIATICSCRRPLAPGSGLCWRAARPDGHRARPGPRAARRPTGDWPRGC